ncbi:MAG: hypothetical protein RLZZ136_1806 [Pseudomonadota bacterium]|jgi:hypothetical protein
MHEGLNPWTFVIAAYGLGLGGTFALVASSWIAMLRAEKRRDRSRDL